MKDSKAIRVLSLIVIGFINPFLLTGGYLVFYNNINELLKTV
jgi:hypothetical protein